MGNGVLLLSESWELWVWQWEKRWFVSSRFVTAVSSRKESKSVRRELWARRLSLVHPCVFSANSLDSWACSIAFSPRIIFRGAILFPRAPVWFRYLLVAASVTPGQPRQLLLRSSATPAGHGSLSMGSGTRGAVQWDTPQPQLSFSGRARSTTLLKRSLSTSCWKELGVSSQSKLEREGKMYLARVRKKLMHRAVCYQSQVRRRTVILYSCSPFYEQIST